MTTSTGGQLDLSHWALRLVAYIIDGVILFIATAILGAIIGVMVALTSIATGGSLFLFGGIWVTFGIFGLLSILYFIILDVVWGGTIGKRVMGLQVTSVTSGRITYDKSFIRNISKVFWLLLLIDWLIGVVTDGPDKRQKLADRLAGTTVVQLRQPFQSTAPPPSPPPAPPS